MRRMLSCSDARRQLCRVSPGAILDENISVDKYDEFRPNVIPKMRELVRNTLVTRSSVKSLP